MHGSSQRGTTPPPIAFPSGPTHRVPSGGATSSSTEPPPTAPPSSAPSTREPTVYKSDRETTTPPSAPSSTRLPPPRDDRRYIEPSSPKSAHLPAISHARAGPSPMSSSHNAGNPNHPSGGHQHPHPGPPVRQLSNSGYGAPPQGHYSSNGAVMHSQMGYPPQNPAYSHVQAQQSYAGSSPSPSITTSGQQFAYAPMHSPVHYGPSQARVPPPPAAYNYASYASPYSSAAPRVTQSPTELQSPMTTGGRYPVHPSPADVPPSHTPSLGPPKNRKRKSMGEKGGGSDDEEGSPNEMTPGGAAADRMSKRTKTQRACDPCRRKKIRCDILQDADPPTCQHCKQYGFDCTFFLPITETRFKKKKELEEAAKVKEQTDSQKDPAQTSQSPQTKESQIKGDVKIYGPTSLHYLMHATNNVPRQAFDRYDARWSVSLKVGPKGDGFIHVNEPEPGTTDEDGVKKETEAVRDLDRATLEELVNSYFEDIFPYFPVLTKDELVAQVETFPGDRFLLYAVALAAACHRGVSQEQFESLRSTLNHIMRGQDTLSVSNVPNVQGLLIMQLCFDTHTTYMTQPATANYLRTGTAIRMAQDMGMHRAEAGEKTDIERRRRVWACCLIVDRWMAAAMGHPFMIDRLDCDVRLPPEEPLTTDGTPRPMAYLGNMLHLSLILGDVLKLIYGPTGIDRVKDDELQEVVKKLDAWKAHLPQDLQFTVNTKSVYAGILHMMHTCISIIFWRVFMRITYQCPIHIKFSLTVERWSTLVQASKDAVEWFCHNRRTWDLWWVVSYNMTSISLCLFQTWTRRKDAEAAESLKKLRDATQEWEGAFGMEQQKNRRKTSELIALLFEATQSSTADKDKAVLNPTAGVNTRKDATPMIFKRDESRPGGGVYVLDKAADLQKHQDLPPGTFVVEGKPPVSAGGEAASTATQEQTPAGPPITVTIPNYPSESVAQGDFIGAFMNPVPSMHLGGVASNPTDAAPGMENLNPALAMPDASVQQMYTLNTLGQDLSELGDITMNDYAFTGGEGLPQNIADWVNDLGNVYFRGSYYPAGFAQTAFPYGGGGSGSSQSGSSSMNMQPHPPHQ